MNATIETIHCFEKAGLGKAPFRYLGMVDQEISHGNRVIGSIGGCQIETKPGGTCDFCGTAIMNIFNVESSDGHKFHVGCECIKKTGDDGLIHMLDRDVAKMNKKRREDKKAAALAADQLLCEMTPLSKFSSLPHPHPYRASQGETAVEWVRFMREHGYWKSLAVFIRLNVK